MRSIAAAVHDDAVVAREAYERVARLCKRLGAEDADLVPFDKYAAAASSLEAPSSAASALAGGATHIERVDRLVQTLARSLGMQLDEVDRTVDAVDGGIAANRIAQGAPSGARVGAAVYRAAYRHARTPKRTTMTDHPLRRIGGLALISRLCRLDY